MVVDAMKLRSSFVHINKFAVRGFNQSLVSICAPLSNGEVVRAFSVLSIFLRGYHRNFRLPFLFPC
jgi:hypothetical protein